MDVSVFPHVPKLVSNHIHAAITSRTHERVGPFLAAFDTHTTDVWRNYAVPDDDATPSRHDVSALVAAFTRHHRTPRLEYVSTAAPEVESALTAAGFAVEGRPPIMVSTPDVVLTPRAPAGITLGFATDDSQLFEAATVQHEAYGQPDPPGPHDVARLRATVARGGLVAVARDGASGTVIGTGLVDRTMTLDRIGELAAVGVLPQFRRRGVASAVSVHLARAAHEQGVRLVWLEAAPEEEQIYVQAGFVIAGQKLWISLR
jgi:ribosomal protein S18 acetylase RimI-like enzyme